MQAVCAPVKPHAISPATGETLALEDAIAGWIERDARGLILVSGDAGSGRTTAIRHLAAVLPSKPHLRFVDHSDQLPDELTPKSIGNLLVITSIDEGGNRKGTGEHILADYRLARWSMDDVIDYLLFRWPDRCASVVARLKTADELRGGECESLEGIPGVWRVALDRMAQDETLTSPVDVVLDEIATLLGSPERLSVLQDFCLIVAAKRSLPKVSPDIGNHREQIIRLTAPRGILLRIAAAGVIASLKGPCRPRELSPALPVAVVKETGARVDDFVVSRLKVILGDDLSAEFHASAAGILLAANPHWRPERAKLMLNRAVLDGAEWAGIELSGVILSSASLVSANLAHSDLTQAKVDYADFRSADLREANLTKLDGVQANFCGSNLGGASGQNAWLTFARFERARLDNARLDNTMFRGANLSHSSCQGACLKAADLKHALVEEADFRGVIFDAACLDYVALGNANVLGASFNRASLQQCNLEFIEPGSGADFRSACLFGSHLTGAQLPNARMEAADLRATGLAEINLEGADLRKVLFDGATFHMGSSRSGLVGSSLASEGTRTGFYTDEYEEQHYRDPEEVRKANLCGADLREAKVSTVDFYLVDLRGAIYDEDQHAHFVRCGAILD